MKLQTTRYDENTAVATVVTGDEALSLDVIAVGTFLDGTERAMQPAGCQLLIQALVTAFRRPTHDDRCPGSVGKLGTAKKNVAFRFSSPAEHGLRRGQIERRFFYVRCWAFLLFAEEMRDTGQRAQRLFATS